MQRILIVDDEQNILDSLSLILTYNNYDVDTCLEGFTAIEKVKSVDYDLILLDIKMPKMDGIEVLEKIMEINKDNVVIMISGHGNIETAVEATKKGAYNFLQKPLPDLHELKLTIKNAIEYKKSKEELKNYRQALLDSNKIVGRSKEIENVADLILKYADIKPNVFITGESGTGKILVARQIHLHSSRSDKPFININCANLTEDNADEELFGLYEDKALKRMGQLENAQGGMILFDEISNLSLEVQSKILRVIEENKFTRMGKSDEINIDVRFMFSTNKDIESEIKDGNFRDDLFHRINVLCINIPPLRERPEDIEQLIKFFSGQICKAYNVKPKEFTEQALNKLKTFRWPGNVRELKNLIERLIFSVDKKVIDADDIEIPGTKHSKYLNDLINKNMSLNEFQNESEKIFIMKMLNDYKYNVTQTAEALKIQRSHMYKLMNKYNIPLPSKVK
jgi:DNA-binding NtrC family response regulator